MSLSKAAYTISHSPLPSSNEGKGTSFAPTISDKDRHYVSDQLALSLQVPGETLTSAKAKTVEQASTHIRGWYGDASDGGVRHDLSRKKVDEGLVEKGSP